MPWQLQPSGRRAGLVAAGLLFLCAIQSLAAGDNPAPAAKGPAPRTIGPGRESTIALPGPQIILESPGAHATWYDGERVTLKWTTVGAVAKVRFYYWGDRCSLGGEERGTFEGLIGGGMADNEGEIHWQVPFLDGPYLNLRAAAYDDEGGFLSATARRVQLLPREAKGEVEEETFIVICKRLQRLWYVEDGTTRRMHIISTAMPGYNTPNMRPGSGGSHGATGRVFYKADNPFSHEYHVFMPHWLAITSSGSHGIHATSPPFYDRLGSPASHGCVRQHRHDAAILYDMVEVGTPVYVFGGSSED